MSGVNERTERAWVRLENWARSWHRPDAPSYFAGSLGGASLSQVYFGNVLPDAIAELLTPLDVEFLLAKWGDGPNEAAGLLLRDVSAFLASRRADVEESCFILARAKVPMPGGTFEPQIVIETLAGASEVRITWVPLLAFHRIRDLRARFFEILRWFFSVQHILETDTILLCLENCPHPSTDHSAWMEI